MTGIIGIDPGRTGGVAMLTGGPELMVADLPYIGGEVDVRALVSMLRAWGASPGDRAAVEFQAPFAMPGRKMGATSAFALGEGYGMVRAACYALDLQVLLPRPAAWKKALGLTSKEKDVARMKALQLFPLASPYLARKLDHGRAEALLIAEWARLQP